MKLEIVEVDTAQVKSKALSIVEQANLAITDQESYNLAAFLIKGVKELLGEIKDAFAPTIDAAHKAHKAALAAQKKHAEPLELAETSLRRKMGAWINEQERLKRLEQIRLYEIAKATQKAAEEAAQKQVQEEAELLKALGAEPEQMPKPIEIQAASIPTIEKIDTAGMSTRDNWTYAIVDATKIPREFLIPDEKKIGAYVKAMKDNAIIVGVEVKCEKILIVK